MAKKTPQPLTSRQRQSNNIPSAAQSQPSSGDTIVDDDTSMTNGQSEGYATPPTYDIAAASSAALDILSRESNRLTDAINQISLLGIEHQAFELPKIVTVGDQSAGKSSAIAAISGITVPRSSGMCTRCPSHICLKRSSGPDWSCTISLEKRYCYPDRSWRPQDPKLIELCRITSSFDLQSKLERAQIACLNPHLDPKSIMSTTSELPPSLVELSPNLVRLDIEGPHCPNLTFYDLPGIFNQTAKKEKSHLVHEVRELVMSYVNQKSNIILLACPMDNDIETSTAASLIDDEAKHRCIGLLTKADRLPEGYPTKAWSDVLEGRTFWLKHGYFVTKQPGQADLQKGIDHETARKLEEHFFTNASLWNTALASHKHRFGIPKLQARLSKILVEHIRSSLPRLRVQVDARLDTISKELITLPEPPGDRSFSIVHTFMTDLRSRLERHMRGELPYNQFINEWLTDSCQTFRADLYSMRPTLVVKDKEEREHKHAFSKSFSPEQSQSQSQSQPQSFRSNAHNPITLDDDEPRMPHTPVRKRQAPIDDVSPSKRHQALPIRTSIKPEPMDDRPIYDPNLLCIDTNALKIDEVANIRLRMNTSAVIGTSDHRADEFLIGESIKRWPDAVDKIIYHTTERLGSLIESQYEDLLSPWGSTKFAEVVPVAVRQFVASAQQMHQQHAHHYLNAERLQPMSLNEKSIKSSTSEETKIFKDARRRTRAEYYVEKAEIQTGKPTFGDEREKELRKVKDEQLGEDKYMGEIEAMGRVRGYYNVASANLVDTLTKFMRLDLFEHVRQGLVTSLEEKLELHTANGFDNCKVLLKEDPERAQRRAYLLKEQTRFQEAKKSLDALYQQPTQVGA